jgi:hypothetical protein
LAARPRFSIPAGVQRREPGRGDFTPNLDDEPVIEIGGFEDLEVEDS